MARETWVIRNGELVDKRFAAPLESSNPTAYVISDTMKTAAPHPCTGKMMDSKAAFRRVTREHGCVEIGTETKGHPRQGESPNAIAHEIARQWR